MTTNECLKFESPDEEISYWKSKLEEAQIELEEYQISSKELELELETQLTQSEKECRELRQANNKLMSEREAINEKYATIVDELRGQNERLEEELAKEKSVTERLNRIVRELEQDNDDLERSKRTLVASLEEFDAKLNMAIERNAFLESELDEKEQLSTMVQRLKEESRDLQQELSVQQQRNPSNMLEHGDRSLLDSPVTSSGTKPSTPESSSRARRSSNSSHANALDIVNDLLRGVGSLMSVVLTPPPSRRRTPSRKWFQEKNNNSEKEGEREK